VKHLICAYICSNTSFELAIEPLRPICGSSEPAIGLLVHADVNRTHIEGDSLNGLDSKSNKPTSAGSEPDSNLKGAKSVGASYGPRDDGVDLDSKLIV